MTKEVINIGSIIEKKLKALDRTPSWFAKMLSCDGSTVYRIFKKQTIDASELLRISLILKTNFFEYYTNRFMILSKDHHHSCEISATMSKEVIHIGSIIEKELKSLARTPTWFAKKLSRDPSTIFRLFKKESIDTSELLRISLILKTNFLEYYTNKFNHFVASSATLL